MLAYWIDNIKYRSILSDGTVRVSTLVNYRSIFSNRTVNVKLTRGGHGPPWPPLRVAYGSEQSCIDHHCISWTTDFVSNYLLSTN